LHQRAALQPLRDKMGDIMITDLANELLLKVFTWLAQAELGAVMRVSKRWNQVAGARWPELPVHLLAEHLQWPKVDSISSITRLEKVKQLHVTAPPNMFSLATIRLILESFTSLQEMVVDLPGVGLWDLANFGNTTGLITIAKELDTRSVSCCISDTQAHLFVSPSVDLIKRKPVTSGYVFLYTRSLCRDLSQIIGTAPGGQLGAACLLSKLTGDATTIQSWLKKMNSFHVWREPADLEVLEEEVAAANVVLNLLADEKKKRGRLTRVRLPKVLLLRCNDWVERLGGKEKVERRSEPVWIEYFEGNRLGMC